MAFPDIFKNIGIARQALKYARMMSGYIPVFSQFGDDVYASDVVQNCVDAIASEISKLQPRHIRTDVNGVQTTPRSSLNRLFKFGPNEFMTTHDFLEKCVWILFQKYNLFIYPRYELTTDGAGNVIRDFSGFYPLNVSQVDFMQDPAGVLYIKIYFPAGDNYTLPYSQIIHIRKKYSLNDYLGGGADGLPDNRALLKVLTINDAVTQGLEKGVKTSMAVRGVMKVSNLFDEGALKAEREKIEARIFSGESGIIPMDLKGDFVPFQIDPKLVDTTTLSFLQDRVLNWYGVSVPILTGKYSDEEYQAFYEKALEPLVISFGQAFSKGIFSARELDVGNEMIFYPKDLMYLSAPTKLELLKTVGEQGLLMDDEKLAILGYPPLPNGEGKRRTQSLNYIDTRLINQYQISKLFNPDGTSGDPGSPEDPNNNPIKGGSQNG